MIVILHNGTRIKIPQQMAQEIVQALLKDGSVARSWHCITNVGKNEVSGFNMAYVAAICSEEDIL